MELDRQPYPFRGRIAGAIASTALLAGCSVIGNKEAPASDVAAPQIDPTLIVPTDIIRIGGDLYCYSRYHRGDFLPQEEGTVVADGRCAEDPGNPVAIYGGVNYENGTLAKARTGAVLVALCFEMGNPVQNLAGEPLFGDDASRKWIRIKLEKTYTSKSNIGRVEPYEQGETPTVPATWVQGAENVTKECK